MAVPTKQYGLILSQKKGASKAVLSKPSIFGDDSDEETSVGESLQKEAIKKKMMKQTRLEMQKALDQDSTVYDYDGVYDDIQKQRLESNKKTLGSADRRPKYIHQLMKAVEDRKKEQERRDERKIQKEREAEGEQYADKEAYVTSAYKKKLEEQKEEEEKERRQAEIEAALDVRKQKDLSGFHRHLLNQIVGEEAIPDRTANNSQSSDALKETGTSSVPTATSQKNDPSSGSENEESHEEKTGFIKPGGSAHSNRQYRQRSPSSGSEEREAKRDGDRKKKSHKDKDRERHRDRHRGRERDDRYGDRRSDKDRRKERDRGRDDDRSRGRGEAEREDRHRKRERSPKEREREKNGTIENRSNSSADKHEKEKEQKKEQKVLMPEEKDAEKQGQKSDGEQKEQEEEEEKTSKFAKRSTEHTVSSARERYLARQMARSSSKSYVEKED
ncbi:nuclear speckle splicing regulatory protein 1 [Nothobranchius furzeri]|uniref:Nuclear speckle splicing regulatory protein 1 n=1 Tax=Nothobranchius furzeri TaxID=105023 RepID=A0A1A8B512_NOTFU|nr:nuclear speckle splicing regulatory protein 1-like [Nothobranchius furzeri]